MSCELCNNIEEYRILKETKYSKVVICKWPLKPGHVIVIPKKCISQLEISKLNFEELRDFMNLIQEIENLLNSKFEENCITFKNSGKHSSQAHLHYHLLPAKGSLRDLFSTYENIPKRKEISKEKYIEIRDKLLI